MKRRNLCSIYFGDDETEWFAPAHVMYLCLQLAGLVSASKRCCFFILYEPRRRPRKSRFLVGPGTRNN